MNHKKLQDWIIRLRVRLEEKEYAFYEFKTIDMDLLSILEALLEE